MKVGCSYGFTVSAAGASEPKLIVDAVNVGLLAVTISSLELVLPDQRKLLSPGDQWQPALPHELASGKSFKVYFPAKPLALALAQEGHRHKVKLRPACTDQTGCVYRGKPFSFDVAAWMK
jgi:hypothetical protein